MTSIGARATLLTLALTAAATAAAETTRYSVILAGNEAGEMVVDRPSSKLAEMTFSFNDRGRGPDIRAEYVLDEAGIPIAVTIEGVDYMKAPVSETLAIEEGAWAWRSSADSGIAERRGFYTSLDGPPGELDLLIRALLADDDRTLPLLPQGEVRLELVGEATVGDQTLRHGELQGLGFEPSSVWIAPDDGLFAVVSGWFSLVREGHQEALADLQARQDARRDARYRAVADSAIGQRAKIVIDNARIFDVVAGAVRPETGVVVDEGRIVALLAPEAPRPDDAIIVDADGQTLLPGLWDMHTHISPVDGALHLAAGVTTVRDLANDHDQVMALQQAWDSGEAPGPHVFRAGFIDGTGPFAGPTKARIETAEEGAEWIDFYAEHGYDQIKIYSSIPIGLVEGMAERAHEHGMRFSGHIPAGLWAADAVRAGFDEIQHINMIFLNFYKDIVETRNPDRFIKVAERGADLDPESAPFREFLELLLERGTVVDPTVAVFMDLFVHEPGQLAPSLRTAQGRLPPEVQRGNLKGGLPVPEGWESRYEASANQMLVVIKALHEAGVPLVAGTDGLAGFVLQAELAYYQQAGISAADILELATVGSARVMGVADEVGTIEPGMRADLILVDGLPDENISQINRVSWVMKAGQPIDPSTLYRSLSIQPFEPGGG